MLTRRRSRLLRRRSLPCDLAFVRDDETKTQVGQKSMRFQLRLKFARTCLKKASMHVTRMHDVEIDRYPTISTSACVRSGLTAPPETARARGFATRVGESGAAPEPHRPRPDAERVLSYGPRPHGSYGRHRGRHRQPLVSRRKPKRSIFAPRGAFGRGRAMFTGGRNRDPMPSGTPTPFPHTMRGRPDHRSASAVPVLTVGAGGRNV